jgi:hypothetical protein
MLKNFFLPPRNTISADLNAPGPEALRFETTQVLARVRDAEPLR